MGKKRAEKSGHASSPEPPTSPLRSPVPPPPLSELPEPVKVSTVYSATELKNACDDQLKRYIARPDTSFSTVNRHTDVKLALGWTSVLVAALTAGYGYKVDFEKSKTGVSIGLLLYILLTTAQALYTYFIEGYTIFIGKRMTYAKRVESERIRVESRTMPAKYHSKANQPHAANAPVYQISMSYIRLTKAKTLVHKGKERAESPYSAFFDSEGNMEIAKFETWVSGVMARTMGIRSESGSS